MSFPESFQIPPYRTKTNRLMLKMAESACHLLFRSFQVIQNVGEVHFHVTFLNTGGNQGAYSGKILCQSNRSSYAHQFSGRRMPQKFKRTFGERM